MDIVTIGEVLIDLTLPHRYAGCCRLHQKAERFHYL